jgi:hypothetical protein
VPNWSLRSGVPEVENLNEPRTLGLNPACIEGVRELSDTAD